MYRVVFDKDPQDLAQLRGGGGLWDGDGGDCTPCLGQEAAGLLSATLSCL